MTFVTKKPVTVEEVNAIFNEEAQTEHYSKVITTTTAPIVSSDILKSPFASTLYLSLKNYC